MKGSARRGVAALALAVSALVAVVVPVPAGAAPTVDPAPRELPGAVAVVLTATDFQPSVITAVAGQSVVFANDSGATRSVAAEDGLFDSGPIPAGGAFTVAVPEARQIAVTSPGPPALSATLSVGQLEVAGPSTDPVSAHLPDLGAPPEDPDSFAADPVWGAVASRTVILVKFQAAATVADANRLLAAIDGTISGTVGDTGIVRVVIPDRADRSFADLEAALAALRADPAVAYAARDTLGQPATIPTDNLPPELTDVNFAFKPYPPSTSAGAGAFGLTQARFPQAWNLLDAIKRKRSPVDTVILDNGVTTSHPEFAARPNQPPRTRTFAVCPGVRCENFEAGDHGTPVAGLAGGTNVGGNPVARLVGVQEHSLKTPSASGVTAFQTSTELTALVDEKRPGGALPDLRVINFSNADFVFTRAADGTTWSRSFEHKTCGPGDGDDVTGTEYCTPNNEDGFRKEVAHEGMLRRELAARAGAKNIVIVASGGNYGDASGGQGSFCVPFNEAPCQFERIRAENIGLFAWASHHWPSGSESPILVVGGIELNRNRAGYSTVGNDVSAGSSDLISAAELGGYKVFTGTSGAAPLVTGLVGLIAAYEPRLTAGEIRRLVIAHANPDTTEDVGPRIDAYATLTAIPGALIDALDVNDASLDGNRRVIRSRARSGTADASDDRLGDVVDNEQLRTQGDGSVDMRDFRRYRDAWLQGCLTTTPTECPAAPSIKLDGDPSGPKRDLNFDGCVVSCTSPESLYPRFDGSGTGGLDRFGTGRVTAIQDGVPQQEGPDVVLDPLQVLQGMWGRSRADTTRVADTEGWAATNLPALMESGDVEVHADGLFALGATQATITVSYSNDSGTTWQSAPAQTLTAPVIDGYLKVVTVPVTNEGGAKVRARVSSTVGGKAVKSLLATGTVGIGGDIRLDPCIATAAITSSTPVLSTKGKAKLTLKVDACGQPVASSPSPTPFGPRSTAAAVAEDNPEGTASGLTVDFTAGGTGADPADPKITREDTTTDDQGVATADVDAGDQDGDATFESTVNFEDGATVSVATTAKVLTAARLVYRWEQTVTDWSRTQQRGGTIVETRKPLSDPPLVLSRSGSVDLDTGQVTERYTNEQYRYEGRSDGSDWTIGTHGLFPGVVDRDFVYDLPRGIDVRRTDRAVTVDGFDHLSDIGIPYDCGDIAYCTANPGTDPRSHTLEDQYLTVGPRYYVKDSKGRYGGDGTSIQHAPQLDAALSVVRGDDGTWRPFTYCGGGDFKFKVRAGLVPYFPIVSGGGHYETRFVATIVDSSGNPVVTLPDCSNPAAPEAEFASDPDPGRAGTPTDFTDRTNAPAGVVTYAWEFGDGTTSTVQSPSHLYTVPGGYSVKLTVTDAAGRVDSVTHHVEVLPEPPAARLDDVTVAAGTRVVLHGQISSPSELDRLSLRVDLSSPAAGFPIQRQRRLPAGPIDIDLGALPTGTYPVTMVVTDLDGQTATASATVVVQTQAPLPPVAEGPVVLPAGGDCASGVEVPAEVGDLVHELDALREGGSRLEVVASPTLMAAADRHAHDVASHPELVDTGSDGSTPGSRAEDAGYPADVGEIVLRRSTGSAADAVAVWRTLPAAEATLLAGRWVAFGAARAETPTGFVWVVVLGEAIDCAGDGGPPVQAASTPTSSPAAAPVARVEGGGAEVAGAPVPAEAPRLTSSTGPMTDAVTGAAPPAREPPSRPGKLGLVATPLPTRSVPAFVVAKLTPTTAEDVQVTNRTRRAGAPVPATFTAGDGRVARNFAADAGLLVRWPSAGSPTPTMTGAVSVAEPAPVTATVGLVVTGATEVPAISYTGPASGAQGASVAVSARLTGTGGAVLPGWPVRFTVGTGTVIATSGDNGIASGTLVVPSSLALGDHPLTVQALPSGASPGATTSLAFNVTGNIPPVAVAGGPYALLVDEPLALDASASIDPDGGGLVIGWDLGDDGDAPERIGTTPAEVTYAQAQTELCGGTCEPGVAYAVAMTATDENGAQAVEHTTVTYRRDYLVTIGPATQVLNPGGSSVYEVSVLTSSGFADAVQLSVSGLPAGVTGSFSQPIVEPNHSALLTLRASSTIQPGATSFTVTGTSGSLVRTTASVVDLEFGLVPECAAALEGTVTDRESGLPLAGVAVRDTTTDASGHFLAERINLGRFAVREFGTAYDLAGYYGETKYDTYHCDAVSHTTVTLLKVHTGTALVGTLTEGVRDPSAPPAQQGPIVSTGVPIPGVAVVTQDVTGAQRYDTTTADGSYRIGPMRLNAQNTPATGSLTVAPAGYWAASPRYSIGPDETVTTNITAVKACTASATIRVLDDVTGQAVSGISVWVQPSDRPGGFPLTIGAVSDANGLLTLRGIPLGYNNSAVELTPAVGGDASRGIVPVGAVRLHFAECGAVDVGYATVHQPVKNFGNLDVTVVDDDTGLPVSPATVVVSAFEKVTPASGTVSFPDLFLGNDAVTSKSFLVAVRSGGYYDAYATAVVKRDETLRLVVRVQQPKKEVVTGTVTDFATGLPLAGFTVMVTGAGGVVTDSQGHYRFERDFVGQGQNSGIVGVSALDQLGYWGTESEVAVTIPQGGTSVADIALLRECQTATIRGRVSNASTHLPLEGARVQAGGVFSDTVADGSFSLTGLRLRQNRPGIQYVTASKSGFISATKMVTISCGANLVVDFGNESGVGSIEGTVTRASDRAAVANAFVSTEFGGAATTAADGTYSIADAPLGADGAPKDWKVSVTPASGSGLGSAEKSVTVTSSGPTTLDFELDGPVLPAKPQAVDDAVSLTANEQRVFDAADGVLANDTGTSLVVSASTQPAHGIVTMAPDGSFTYDARGTNFIGSDSFTYTVVDSASQAATAIVLVQITGPPGPAVADDSGSTAFDTELVVPAPGVLANDVGTSLHVTDHSQPTKGSVTIAADGSYTYTPAAGASGTDSFGYTVTDLFGRTASATVAIDVDAAPPVVRLAIGDLVFRDVDGNGIQDSGEPGFANVSVQLLNGEGSVLSSTITGADGRYAFDDLAVGDYAVRFVAPAGYGFTGASQGTDRLVDSDPDADGAVAAFALEPGADPRLSPVTDDDAVDIATLIDRSIDAGLVPLPAGIAVTKSVRAVGSAAPFATLAQGPLGTAFIWHVDIVNTADVALNDVVVIDAGFAGCDRSVGTLAAHATQSYDCTGTDAPTHDVTNEVDVTATVGSRTEPDAPPDAAEPGRLLTASATARVELTYSLGDRIWDDRDHDGIQDDDESGVGGVAVALLDPEGELRATTVSDGEGAYRFDGVRPGSFRMRFTRPSGYRWTLAGVGDDRAVDSDAIAASASDATATSALITVTDGQTPVASPNPLTLTDPRVDGGVWRPASINGVVFADIDHDGTHDAVEPGIPGVKVELMRGEAVVDTQTSGADARYAFVDLVPGTYRVRITAPTGYSLPGTTGSAPAAIVGGTTPDLVLLAGQVLDGTDLGLWPDQVTPTSTTTTTTTTTAPTSTSTSTSTTTGPASTSTSTTTERPSTRTSTTSSTVPAAVSDAGAQSGGTSSGLLPSTGGALGDLVVVGLLLLLLGGAALARSRRIDRGGRSR